MADLINNDRDSLACKAKILTFLTFPEKSVQTLCFMFSTLIHPLGLGTTFPGTLKWEEQIQCYIRFGEQVEGLAYMQIADYLQNILQITSMICVSTATKITSGLIICIYFLRILPTFIVINYFL